jgi:hypothetical protein
LQVAHDFHGTDEADEADEADFYITGCQVILGTYIGNSFISFISFTRHAALAGGGGTIGRS